jgi:hypothetical protein
MTQIWNDNPADNNKKTAASLFKIGVICVEISSTLSGRSRRAVAGLASTMWTRKQTVHRLKTNG